jgi:hypothetical protein
MRPLASTIVMPSSSARRLSSATDEPAARSSLSSPRRRGSRARRPTSPRAPGGSTRWRWRGCSPNKSPMVLPKPFKILPELRQLRVVFLEDGVVGVASFPPVIALNAKLPRLQRRRHAPRRSGMPLSTLVNDEKMPSLPDSLILDRSLSAPIASRPTESMAFEQVPVDAADRVAHLRWTAAAPPSRPRWSPRSCGDVRPLISMRASRPLLDDAEPSAPSPCTRPRSPVSAPAAALNVRARFDIVTTFTFSVASATCWREPNSSAKFSYSAPAQAIHGAGGASRRASTVEVHRHRDLRRDRAR